MTNKIGGALNGRDVRKKSHQELSREIEEMKKQRNKDLDDIKRIKVELQKMEVLYRKYKETLMNGG